MERREWRELVQLSKPKPAFERRIGRAQRKQSIGAIPFVKGGPTKAFTRDHFLFYVLFSFLLIPRLSLGVKQSFLRNFLGALFLSGYGRSHSPHSCRTSQGRSPMPALSALSVRYSGRARRRTGTCTPDDGGRTAGKR